MSAKIREVLAVSPRTAAKLAAVVMFGITLVSVLLMTPVVLFRLEGQAPWPVYLVLLVVPFLYAAVGALFAAFAAWLYNIAAKRVGGLEIEVSDKHDA